MRNRMKATAKYAADELYGFVLKRVEQMLTSEPELNFAQVEKAAQELLDDASQAFSSDLLPQSAPKNNPTVGSSSHLPTENLINTNNSNLNPSDHGDSSRTEPKIKKPVFLGSAQSVRLPSDRSNELYSPTNNFKTNSSSVSLNKTGNDNSSHSNQDDDDELENLKTNKSAKRYFRSCPADDLLEANFFSDDSDEEQELMNLINR